jgi:radical SAM superfamily enzyme YgiQ (UPF0313 family)
MRGCTRGCRFCHAGMVTRPVRERPVAEVLKAIQDSLANTGFEEVALLSLSSSDYTNILDLVDQVSQHASQHRLTISLPSLRIESFSVDLMEKLKGARQGGFTLAPEAATERMRNIINAISTERADNCPRNIQTGLDDQHAYFMIGHPLGNPGNVQAIADWRKPSQRSRK